MAPYVDEGGPGGTAFIAQSVTATATNHDRTAKLRHWERSRSVAEHASVWLVHDNDPWLHPQTWCVCEFCCMATA